jgi:hypothetical protein
MKEPIWVEIKNIILDSIRNIEDITTESYSDYFEYMCLYFLKKQTLHIRTYCSIENCHDLLLILRTMIEGSCLLAYANTDAELNAEKWNASYNIELFQHFKDQNELGIRNVNKKISANLYAISIFCGPLKTNSENNRYTVKIGDQRYQKYWYGENSLNGIIKKYGTEYFRILYGESAGWHHWGGLSQERAVILNENGFSFTSKPNDDFMDLLYLTASSYLFRVVKIYSTTFDDISISEQLKKWDDAIIELSSKKLGK